MDFCPITRPALWLFIALLTTNPARAQLSELPPPPVLAAKSYVLQDFTSNQVLVSQNGSERIEPVSLTKLMTAYLAFDAIRQKQISPGQTIVPPASALRMEAKESRMFIESNKPVAVEDLLRGLIVHSGNDAARVLAIVIAGSEENFVASMNREAQRLGMRDTLFANATGLPQPGHYSTALDLAILAAAIIRNFPEHYALYSMREFKYNNILQANRNRLLWMDPFVDGIKTGYSEGAGFCLIASARRGERRLISVLIGTSSDNLRATESQRLLNYGLKNFEAVRLFRKDQPVANLRLWKGTESRISAGFRNDLYLSVPAGQADRLKAVMETAQPLLAPITPGQQIGLLKLKFDDRPYAEFPVIALEGAPVANILSRGWDTIRLLFE